MRVVSWNLWWRFGDHWRERQDGILATLEALQPDVAGLQEVWVGEGTSQAELLGEQLAMYHAVATPSLPPPPSPPEAPDQQGIKVGVAVLSRWPIRAVRWHRLPATHRDPPVALLVTVDHPAGPLHVATSCVEWEPEFADDHVAQARALANLLADPALDGPLPVLLAADLNAAPETPPARALLDDGLVDTWVAGHGDPGAATLSSANPFAPRAARQQIDRRIDYVLARPGTAGQAVPVQRAFVAGGPDDRLPPSDHQAVVTDLAAG
jgi:endonuclease/exonuclease/phosphatase family metal-dependent hydrolase